jgi:hypothetical protein
MIFYLLVDIARGDGTPRLELLHLVASLVVLGDVESANDALPGELTPRIAHAASLEIETPIGAANCRVVCLFFLLALAVTHRCHHELLAHRLTTFRLKVDRKDGALAVVLVGALDGEREPNAERVVLLVCSGSGCSLERLWLADLKLVFLFREYFDRSNYCARIELEAWC